MLYQLINNHRILVIMIVAGCGKTLSLLQIQKLWKKGIKNIN